jgi:predicted DNA-binding transcriptional regulator AlpA
MGKKSNLPPVPPELAEFAYIDARTFAATAGMSVSKLHQLVRDGVAPTPTIREPRFTRWQLSVVKNWLARRAAKATCGGARGDHRNTDADDAL